MKLHEQFNLITLFSYKNDPDLIGTEKHRQRIEKYITGIVNNNDSCRHWRD